MKWYKLDNAGRMYASIASKQVTTLFRLSATLQQDVNKENLQKALDFTIKRFPYFKVTLRKGFFWYYFDENPNEPLVEEEKYYPCMDIDIKKKGTFLFRVCYFKNKISVEFSHVIADGLGASKFFAFMLEQYLLDDNIDTNYHIDEAQNSFRSNYNMKVKGSLLKVNAFKLPFNRCEKGVYFILTGKCQLSKVKELAKNYNTTITIFLASVYIESIIEIMDMYNLKKKPVSINIPVDLRPYFNSTTLQNFFVSIVPYIDPNIMKYSFVEIIEELNLYFKYRLTKTRFTEDISKVEKFENIFFIQLIPLLLKDLAMPFIYENYGESNYTSSISNVGEIKLDNRCTKFIKDITCFPPPSIGSKIKIMVNSFNGNLYINFGKLTYNTELERIFFTKLRQMDIPIHVESNFEEKR